MKKKIAFFIFPVLLILFTRAGLELSVYWIPVHGAWIASFAMYYIFILLICDYARRNNFYDEDGPVKFSKTQKFNPVNLLWGALLPALLPLKFFISNISRVPGDVLIMIGVVALINPFFEERFWRKLMSQMPTRNTVKIIYSAFWFSAGHYLLWATYWFTDPKIWISTVGATFIMGICWMAFFLKTGKYKYIIISHILVDIFNLSAAVYFGINLKTI